VSVRCAPPARGQALRRFAVARRSASALNSRTDCRSAVCSSVRRIMPGTRSRARRLGSTSPRCWSFRGCEDVAALDAARSPSRPCADVRRWRRVPGVLEHVADRLQLHVDEELDLPRGAVPGSARGRRSLVNRDDHDGYASKSPIACVAELRRRIDRGREALLYVAIGTQRTDWLRRAVKARRRARRLARGPRASLSSRAMPSGTESADVSSPRRGTTRRRTRSRVRRFDRRAHRPRRGADPAPRRGRAGRAFWC